MNRSVFYANIRKTLFAGSLTQAQVDGLSAILDALTAANVTDLRQQAYILATPYVETGGSYVPLTENLNYSAQALTLKFPNRITRQDAVKFGRTPAHSANQVAIANIIYGGGWGAKNLGNTKVGDGWLLRGRGLVQITGRRLYKLFSVIIGQDLLFHPDLACVLEDAAKILVVGMRDGLFTGKKVADYLGPNLSNWTGARAVVNGEDRAADIAKDAMAMYAALKAAA